MVLNRRFLLIAILMLALVLPGAAESTLPDCVRLHVVASDDTPQAQALKLKVRDAVLDAARRLLWNAVDADAAWAAVRENLDALNTAARARAAELGFTGPIRCETGIFAFPDRDYGDVTLPAGNYRALRVVIGAGEGHNWWCVLFPSLCYPEAWRDESRGLYALMLDWLRAAWGGGAS